MLISTERGVRKLGSYAPKNPTCCCTNETMELGFWGCRLKGEAACYRFGNAPIGPATAPIATGLELCPPCALQNVGKAMVPFGTVTIWGSSVAAQAVGFCTNTST